MGSAPISEWGLHLVEEVGLGTTASLSVVVVAFTRSHLPPRQRPTDRTTITFHFRGSANTSAAESALLTFCLSGEGDEWILFVIANCVLFIECALPRRQVENSIYESRMIFSDFQSDNLALPSGAGNSISIGNPLVDEIICGYCWEIRGAEGCEVHARRLLEGELAQEDDGIDWQGKHLIPNDELDFLLITNWQLDTFV